MVIMRQEALRNKGFISSQRKGYLGQINIEGVKLAVTCEFWRDRQDVPFIHIRRQPMKVFDEKTNKFKDIQPKPYFECYAPHTGDNYPHISYRGHFVFAKFQYELIGRWNNRDQRTLTISVSRTDDQPIIERLNKIMKEK